MILHRIFQKISLAVLVLLVFCSFIPPYCRALSIPFCYRVTAVLLCCIWRSQKRIKRDWFLHLHGLHITGSYNAKLYIIGSQTGICWPDESQPVFAHQQQSAWIVVGSPVSNSWFLSTKLLQALLTCRNFVGKLLELFRDHGVCGSRYIAIILAAICRHSTPFTTLQHHWITRGVIVELSFVCSVITAAPAGIINIVDSASSIPVSSKNCHLILSPFIF